MRHLLLILCLLPSLLFSQQVKLDSLLKLLPQNQNNASFLNDVAAKYAQSKPDSVRYFGEKALAISLSTGNKNDITESYNRIGFYYTLIGKADTALVLFKKSLSISKQANNYFINATNLTNIGYANLLNGNTKEANTNLYEAKLNLDKAEKNNKTDVLYVKTYMYLAELSHPIGLYDKAFEYAYKGLSTAENIGDVRLQALLNNTLGNINNSLKNHAKAVEYFKAAIVRATQVNDMVNLQKYLSNTADQYVQLSQFDSAKTYLGKSLLIWNQIKNPATLAFIYKAYGKVFNFQYRYDSAIYYLNLAKEKYNDAGADDKAADCYYWIGDVNKQQDKVEDAISNYKQALQIYTTAEEIDQSKDVLEALAEMENRKGNYAAAFNYQKQLKIVTDSIYNEDKADAMVAAEIKYETAIKESTIANQKLQIKEEKKQKYWLVGGLLILALVAIALSYFYNRIKKQKAQIQHQKEEIIHNNQNNIQQLISIFSRQTSTEAIRENARSNQERLFTLNLLNKLLYENGESNHANVNEYLNQLTKAKEIGTGNEVEIKFDSPSIIFKSNMLKDIGLIVNELTTNAIKYAFANKLNPSININLQQQNNQWLNLSVQDNGNGLPNEFNLQDDRQSFGLDFVKDLVQQHHGKIKAFNNNGAYFEMQLKIS